MTRTTLSKYHALVVASMVGLLAWFLSGNFSLGGVIFTTTIASDYFITKKS